MSIAMITLQELLLVKAEMLQEIKTIMLASPHYHQRQWLKTWEVKQMLGVSLGTLRNMRDRRQIEYTKIGGLLFYNHQNIMQLKKKNKKQVQNMPRKK